MADARKINWKYWGSVALIGVAGYFVGKWIGRTGVELVSFRGELGLSEIVAFGIGAVYALMGLVLVVAVVAPRFTAPALSGVTAEDIQDDRQLYIFQAISAFFLGAALIAFAGSGPLGMFDRTAGGIAFALLMLVGAAFYAISMPKLDELLKASTIEAAAISYGLTLLGIGMWAALGHVGLVPAPAMLDIVSSFWIVALVASFWASARRGMLTD